jgi:hypothetical protein
MHFLLFEDFIKDPKTETKKIINFSGADERKYKFVEEKRNKTILPRFPFLLNDIKRYFGRQSIIFRLTRKLFLIGKKPGYEKLNKNLRNQLQAKFQKKNKQLKKVTSLNTDIWGC